MLQSKQPARPDLHQQGVLNRPRRRQVCQQAHGAAVAGQRRRPRRNCRLRCCGALRAARAAAAGLLSHPFCSTRSRRNTTTHDLRDKSRVSQRSACCNVLDLCHFRTVDTKDTWCRSLTQRALPCRLGSGCGSGTRLQEGEEGGRCAQRLAPLWQLPALCCRRRWRRRRQQLGQAALQEGCSRCDHLRRQPANVWPQDTHR